MYRIVDIPYIYDALHASSLLYSYPQEYLARTSGPVTLEDIVSVHGSAAVIPKVQSKEHAKETDRSSIRQTAQHVRAVLVT